MPQLDRATVKERAMRLRAKALTAFNHHIGSLVGSEQMLLVEKQGVGRTPCFAPAQFFGSASASEIVRARVTGVRDGSLVSELQAT